MTSPGDDEPSPIPPTARPSNPPSPAPLAQPHRAHVDEPRVRDGGTDPYAPEYDPQTSETRWGLLAPIAAAVVLIAGVGWLVASSGSDDAGSTSTPEIVVASDPDDPIVESTVPNESIVDSTVPDDSQPTEVSLPPQTSPPLIEPTTTPADETEPPPTTIDSDPDRPSQLELDMALIDPADVRPGDWTEEGTGLRDICGVAPDAAVPTAFADTLFQELVISPIGARQINNVVLTFSDAATAERAVADEADVLRACDSTTIDFGGVQYRVQVDNDTFNAGQSTATEFPCSDQSEIQVIQLFNEEADIPYIGQFAISFRCGRNVSVTTLTTTIDREDLNNTAFINAAVVSNTQVGSLPGS